MTRISDAILWNGSGAEVLLFVVFESESADIEKLEHLTQTKAFWLEDSDGILKGRAICEFLGKFESYPADFENYLAKCLRIAISQGGQFAWFQFEASFDFDSCLSSDIADQIYGFSDSSGITLTTNDDVIASAGWRKLVEAFHQRVFSTQ